MNNADTELVSPPVENRSTSQPGKTQDSPFRATFGPLWATLRSPLFYLSLLIAFITLVVAYQLPYHKSISLDAPGDRAYMVDYYSREQYKDFIYRWVKPSSNLELPGVGQPPILRLKLEMAPRPTGLVQPAIEMRVNGDLFQTVQIDPAARKIYNLTYYASNRPLFTIQRGNLDFWMKMEPFLPKGDPRPLGIVVSQIEIEASGIFETGRPTIPPWGTLGPLLLSLAILGLATRQAGWGARGSASTILATTVPLLIGVVADRALIGLTAPVLLVSVVLAYFFMTSGLLFVGWWLGRRGLLLSIRQAGWLGLIFLLVFTVRAVGINHPSFQTLDHGFRVHEVYALLNEPDLIFSRYYNMNTVNSNGQDSNGVQRSQTAGQWEVATVIPYSPLFYISDFPLGQLFRQDEKSFLYWTNIYALWWETTTVFLLYIIARQAFGRVGNLSGLIGGVLIGFFPLTFLMSSDGGYPTMQAEWLTLLFFALLTGWLYKRQAERLPLGWRSILGGGFVLGLAMLSHTATLLLLGGFMVLFLILLTLWGGRYRYLNRPIVLVGGVGLLLSFGLYYGFYVWPLLTQTLPTLAGKVGQGDGVGKRSETLNGFWEALAAHFHLFPFLITSATLAYLVYLYWHGSRRPTRSAITADFELEVAREISRPVMLVLVAWFGIFLLFSVAASRINLLQKHMIFAIPLFALGCGLALALLLEAAYLWCSRNSASSKSRWPQLSVWTAQSAIVLLVVYFLSVGAYTWFQRVINYVLPAGSG